LNTKQKEQML